MRMGLRGDVVVFRRATGVVCEKDGGGGACEVGVGGSTVSLCEIRVLVPRTRWSIGDLVSQLVARRVGGGGRAESGAKVGRPFDGEGFGGEGLLGGSLLSSLGGEDRLLLEEESNDTSSSTADVLWVGRGQGEGEGDENGTNGIEDVSLHLLLRSLHDLSQLVRLSARGQVHSLQRQDDTRLHHLVSAKVATEDEQRTHVDCSPGQTSPGKLDAEGHAVDGEE